MINPILTGVSSAVQALEALFANQPANPASSSAGAFSTGQGLPTGSAASPQASNASSQFAPATLGFLTALQDPSSAAAGFVSGAETAIGQDVASVGSMLEKLKNALTSAAPGTASVAASALATGSAAAGALSIATTSAAVGALGQLTSGVAGLFGGHHHMHHHHGGAGDAGSSAATASATTSALSLTGGAPAATS